jgi:CheY-like chemotaxis protein
MSAAVNECILIVDNNPDYCEGLAQAFHSENYNVFTATTGEQAFLILRHRRYQIGWLYSSAALPGLIDGWILADEYHDAYPGRPVVISAQDARFTVRGDIVLKRPTVSIVSETVRHVIESIQGTASADLGELRRAA